MRTGLITWLLVISSALTAPMAGATKNTTSDIAFLADIHLHAPIRAAQDLPDKTLPRDPMTGKPLLLRSMNAQLQSTRLFNENSLVLRAALDDIAARNIKLVALPGDFSDDGQPVNINALSDILDEYSERFDMRFYAINGNHDPTRPFTRPGGKHDFLAAEGNEFSLVSSDHPDCTNQAVTLCSDGLKFWGYQEIAQALSDHGFMPKEKDLMYETPFNTAELNKRNWQWCDDNNQCIAMPDMSYVVEPVKGIWLLAIDANVFVPSGDLSQGNFNGSGNAGYNALLKYKPELVTWIADIVKRAEVNNKSLIAFSHFPMADFYDEQATAIQNLMGSNAMQLIRLPTKQTTAALAATGIKLHLGGHMHLFDINREAHDGLLNVQVPSLAAYQPGYTVVSVDKNKQAKIQTVIVKSVPDFDRWFPLYTKEWAYRSKSQASNWDKNVLAANSYLDFTDAHLHQVIRQRYLPREWPVKLVDLLKGNTLKDVFSLMGCTSTANQYNDVLSQDALILIDDYYRTRNAGSFADLGKRRDFYTGLSMKLSNNQCHSGKKTAENKLLKQLIALVAVTVHRSNDDKEILMHSL